MELGIFFGAYFLLCGVVFIADLIKMDSAIAKNYEKLEKRVKKLEKEVKGGKDERTPRV